MKNIAAAILLLPLVGLTASAAYAADKSVAVARTSPIHIVAPIRVDAELKLPAPVPTVQLTAITIESRKVTPLSTPSVAITDAIGPDRTASATDGAAAGIAASVPSTFEGLIAVALMIGILVGRRNKYREA